ncbi:MAG: spore cortex biosynthesis protein YabQ [Clostridia bacterium]|nr:spore cortex biosynthesis protein YabQ [Clostridia bacterium]
MEYIQGLSVQTEIFLLSLGFGFLLGILYDVFRTLRLIISKSAVFTVFMDILYFVLCAILIFSFNLVVDSGKIRLYVLLGDLLGWLVYYFSFGEISIKISNIIISLVRRTLMAISKPFIKLKKHMERKFKKFFLFSKKIIRKFYKKAKFDLQKHRSMVYNLNGYIENNTFKDN